MNFIKTKILPIFIATFALFAMSGCGSSTGSSNGDGITPPPTEATKLVAVQVAPGHTYVVLNESIQYTATAVYSDGTTEDVTSTATWNITDKNIAVINEKGTATGVSVGSVNVGATYSSDGVVATGVANLDVLSTEPEFSSLTIDGNDVVSLGHTEHLKAIATLSDGSTEDANTHVNWTTSSAAIATVDAMGIVTSVELGDVTITATAKSDNSIVATHAMTVTDAIIVSIQIEDGYTPDTPNPITTLDVPITTEHYITAWAIYSDSSRHYINQDVFWWSSDHQIASINTLDSSKVYGRDVGEATITATYEGIEASLKVNVVNNGPTLEKIVFKLGDSTSDNVTSVPTILEGLKTWVTAYGIYEGSTDEVNINRYVSYSSDKPKVAVVIDTLDSNIRGVSEGTAVITATWQGVESNVTAPVIGLKAINIKIGTGYDGAGNIIDIDNPLRIKIGDANKVHIVAYGVDTTDTEHYINSDVFWLSDNYLIAKMSLLQKDSYVTGVIFGKTQVSAKLSGKEGRAAVEVVAIP